jgi:hypothetical protein
MVPKEKACALLSRYHCAVFAGYRCWKNKFGIGGDQPNGPFPFTDENT